MRRTEGEQFSDRTMDHILVLRHQWAMPWWDLTLKTQLDDMTEYKRTGSDETWVTASMTFTGRAWPCA